MLKDAVLLHPFLLTNYEPIRAFINKMFTRKICTNT